VLEGADLRDQVRGMIDDVVTGYVLGATEGMPTEWDLEALWAALKTLYPVSVKIGDFEEEAGGREGMSREHLLEQLKADAQSAYAEREGRFGEEVMRELERRVVLSVLDRKWREHLYEMDYLREGIGLRAYSQRDPLVEYQREGYDMFAAMMDGIKEESVGYLFNLEVQVDQGEGPGGVELAEGDLVEGESSFEVGPALAQASAAQAAGGRQPGQVGAPHIHAKGLDEPKRPQGLAYSAPSESGDAELVGAVGTGAGAEEDPYTGVSRNELCPCGSGKKYKRCHGAPGGPTGMTTRAGG
jgi:preprotein translocase subunit SecA